MARRALVIATSRHTDRGLADLPGATADARALERVLNDPEVGSYEVTTLLDQPTELVRREIEGFFRAAASGDTLLLHVSGHGKRAGPTNRLYLATTSTELTYLASTAIEADFINEQMELSASRRILLLLDCCYSGTFAKGMRTRGEVANELLEFNGRGRFVITASTALQYAYESESTSRDPQQPSVFTEAVVKGLESGEADVNGDGLISADELYDYVYQRVRAKAAGQTPTKANTHVEGGLIVARSRRTAVQEGAYLPGDLRLAMTHHAAWMRRGAVAGLTELLGHDDPLVRDAARHMLHQLTIDPSPMVSDAARIALDWPGARSAAAGPGRVFDFLLDNVSQPSDTDSAGYVPLAVVSNPYFDWGADRPPRTPWMRTVLYEAHVRGMTMRHPDVPEELRGTFAGAAHPAVVKYLADLGVTAVLLLPVAQFVTGRALQRAGLREYWGYATVAPFAPHGDYAAMAPEAATIEFKAMVKALHAAGIEVLVDLPVTFTGEGDHLGPTLSLKGVDNAAFYRLVSGEPSRYVDYSGAGNMLNVRSPFVRSWITAILRYWVIEMHVDGFRIPKAAILGREFDEFDRLAAIFDMIGADPALATTKVIVEPWDHGPAGRHAGDFPPFWCEMNDDFRDAVRTYWRGDPTAGARFRDAFLGSPSRYRAVGGAPTNSVNYVAAHDGFTLHDTVSYAAQHNEANLYRDEGPDQKSWNCGVEGPTDDPEVLRLRGRQRRNLLLTALLALGVPLLGHGDELGRTQCGNANAYCQDNELTWIDWARVDTELLAFTRALLDLRTRHAVFHRRFFLTGSALDDRHPDHAWLTPAGEVLGEDAPSGPGDDGPQQLFLSGQYLREQGSQGQRQVDDSFLLLFNPGPDAVEFALPYGHAFTAWQVELDTAGVPDGRTVAGAVTVDAHAALVLRAQ